MEKLVKHLMEEPEPLEKVRPDVPRSVAAIVRRLMAKKPADRHQTPAELVRNLDALDTEPPLVVPVTKTANRPLWLPPPTHVPLNPDASSDHATHTRVLENADLLGPPPLEVEPSGPSLLEPLCEDVISARRPKETRDTLSLSKPHETEVSTAVATALEGPRRCGVAVDSDPTQKELGASAAVVPAGAAATPQCIDPKLRHLWRRWTALLEIIIEGRGPSRVNGEVYRAVYSALLQTSRSAVESAATPGRRSFYQELVSLVQPWLNLQSLAHTEAHVLVSLLQRASRTRWS